MKDENSVISYVQQNKSRDVGLHSAQGGDFAIWECKKLCKMENSAGTVGSGSKLNINIFKTFFFFSFSLRWS